MLYTPVKILSFIFVPCHCASISVSHQGVSLVSTERIFIVYKIGYIASWR
jgi:hypothetical protein